MAHPFSQRKVPPVNPRWPLLTLLLAAMLAIAAPAQAADPGQTGRWSALQQYPVVPISAAVTGDGKIVAWDQADPGTPHSISPNNGRAIIINPETGAIERSLNLAPASVFCPLITTLPDGKIAIAGGGNDSTNSDLVQLYDPQSKTFGTWSTMSNGRWYAGGSISKHGDILAIGGRGGTGADLVDAASGRNRRLNVNFGGDWYPLALRMPDGRFTIENVTDLRTSNTPTRQILDTSGTGTLTGADDLTLLQRRFRMTATMVGPYTMLGITGGTSRESYLLDVSTGGRPVPKTTGFTKDPHMTGTAVTLPDGSALVIGGNSTGSETYGTPVFGVERWSPVTGQWSSMENTPRQRQYHSVAALLPDGRIWSAGTSVNGSNANEYNGAYFSPPYLFKQDGSGELAPRPEITDAPTSASWGEKLTLRSPQAASIRRASLVRLSATTHQYDFSGTYVPLDVSVSGDRVSMDIPSNGNTVPAGSYMVFLVDSAGVPSKAAIVRIDPAADSTPIATAMMSSQYASQYPAWKGFDGDTSSSSQIIHTKYQSEPWWQVDLGRTRYLNGLTIHNRTDRYGSRLRSAWIFASDKPFTATSVSGTRAQSGVTAVQLPGSVGSTSTVTLNRSARYIRVQLPRSDYLHFRELVPNYGTVPAPSLALSKTSQTDTEVTVRVSNSGGAAGTIQSVALPGAGWAQVSGPSAPFTVPAGGSQTLTLTRGSVDGDLVLTPSSGSALRLALEKAPPPPAPDFSLSTVSSTETEVTVRVANTGTGSGSIESVTLPGAGWSQTAGPSAPFTVPAGGAANLTLQRGSADGDLVVTPSTGSAVRLALTGYTPTSPNLSLTRESQTDTRVVVKIGNSGDGAGMISSVTMPGTGWAVVSGPSTPFAVPAGGSVSLTLARGTADGDLVVTPTTGDALRLALTGYTPPPPPPTEVPDPAAGGWQLNGSSTITGGGLQLTPATADQKGSAFWPTQLDPSGGLTIEFDATIADGTGADGLTMALADPTRGATARSIGGGGGSLGFGGIPGHAVALSSYPNGTQGVANFAGISDGAQAGAWQSLSWLSTAVLPTPLQNTTRHVRVVIANGTLTASIDNITTISKEITLPSRVLLGFTAATGGLTNRHAITNLNVQGGVAPPPPPPPPSSVPDPTAGGWTLNGSSTITGGALQLTAAAADQKGSAFYPTPLSIGTGLTVEYDATIADGSGADGLAMILADPARGATATALGGGGGSLGFGGIPGHAVGLSTFPNGTQTSGNFVGISDGAQTGAWQTLSWLSTQTLITPLQNTTRRVKVTLTRTSITATVDGGATVTKAVALPEQVLLGFSAATGGLTNRHAVANVSVTGS